MTRRDLLIGTAAATLCGGAGAFASRAAAPGSPGPGTASIDPALFSAWAARFVEPSGRVIDDGNRGISHSEGQGYGLLLAAFAGDRAAFERMRGWTDRVLKRPDDLHRWRYDPAAADPMADPNNATDGDLLIAWALAEGAARWGDAALRLAGARIARAVMRLTVIPGEGGPLILPGAAGFGAGDRPDGPVVNPSYWVFPAFPALAGLAPEFDWTGLAASGLDLIARARFGERQLPADWVALGGGRMRPANGFDPVFGWNAIRVPLYLAFAGTGPYGGSRAHLAPFAALWPAGGTTDPAAVDLLGRAGPARFGSSGYRAVPAIVACALDGTRYPEPLRHFEGEAYYPATLRLLALAAARSRYPECL